MVSFHVFFFTGIGFFFLFFQSHDVASSSLWRTRQRRRCRASWWYASRIEHGWVRPDGATVPSSSRTNERSPLRVPGPVIHPERAGGKGVVVVRMCLSSSVAQKGVPSVRLSWCSSRVMHAHGVQPLTLSRSPICCPWTNFRLAMSLCQRSHLCLPPGRAGLEPMAGAWKPVDSFQNNKTLPKKTTFEKY